MRVGGESEREREGVWDCDASNKQHSNTHAPTNFASLLSVPSFIYVFIFSYKNALGGINSTHIILHVQTYTNPHYYHL